MRQKNFVLQAFVWLLSAMLALPTQAFARVSDYSKSTTSADAKEGVPVFYQEIEVNGRKAYISITAVPKEQEAATLESLTKKYGKNFYLMAQEANDPALVTALNSGYLPWISTFQLPKERKNLPLFKMDQIPSSTKQKISDGLFTFYQNTNYYLARIKNYFKGNVFGLSIAAGYSGAMTGFAVYSSGNVEGGAALFAGLLLWNSFVYTANDKWEKALEKAGDSHVTAVEKVAGTGPVRATNRGISKVNRALLSLIGREVEVADNGKLSDTSKKVINLLGQFNLTWVVNVAQVMGVYAVAGMDMATVAGAVAVLSQSYNDNYDIWDTYVYQKLRKGEITEKHKDFYFACKPFVGTTASILGLMNIPYVAEAMFGVVLGGLVAAGFGEEIKNNIVNSVNTFRIRYNALTQTVKTAALNLNTGIQNRLIGAKTRTLNLAQDCVSMLTPRAKPKFPVLRPTAYAAEDTW